MHSITLPPRLAALPKLFTGEPKLWCLPETVPETLGERDQTWKNQRTEEAIRRNVCFQCGELLGRYKVFLISPVAALSRVTMNAPGHHDCMHWLAHVVDGTQVLWTTMNYGVTRPGHRGGAPVFNLGAEAPTSVSWWHERRPATHAEGMAAIREALPAMVEKVTATVQETGDERAAKDLQAAVEWLHGRLPKPDDEAQSG